MRVTAAFSRLLDLPGVWVKKVRFEPGRVVVWVALRRKRLCCPKCSLLDDGARERAGSRLGLAACRSRPLAAGGPRAGCGGCAAPSTACTWRACRSPATAPGSRATSRISSRGWRRRPTRPRSAGWCGSTGRPSGGSSSASATSCCPADRLSDLFEISMDEVAWRKGHGT